MATIINNEFEHGEFVYLRTDEEQRKRIVVSYRIFKDGEIIYNILYGTMSSEHYAFELSKEKDQVTKYS